MADRFRTAWPTLLICVLGLVVFLAVASRASAATAPTVRACAFTNPAAGGDFSATLPTGHVSGDIILLDAQGWKSGGGQTIATPAGWTRLSTGVTLGSDVLEVFYIVDDGSLTSPTINLGTDSGFGNAASCAVQNADSVAFSALSTVTTGTSVTAPTVTPSAGGDLILSSLSGESGVFTAASSGYTDAGHSYDGGYSGFYHGYLSASAPDTSATSGTSSFSTGLNPAGGYTADFAPVPDGGDGGGVGTGSLSADEDTILTEIAVGVWFVFGALLMLIAAPMMQSAFRWWRE